jgi:hypothetical protein
MVAAHIASGWSREKVEAMVRDRFVGPEHAAMIVGST